jgi:hypothetical protein
MTPELAVVARQVKFVLANIGHGGLLLRENKHVQLHLGRVLIEHQKTRAEIEVRVYGETIVRVTLKDSDTSLVVAEVCKLYMGLLIENLAQHAASEDVLKVQVSSRGEEHFLFVPEGADLVPLRKVKDISGLEGVIKRSRPVNDHQSQVLVMWDREPTGTASRAGLYTTIIAK